MLLTYAYVKKLRWLAKNDVFLCKNKPYSIRGASRLDRPKFDLESAQLRPKPKPYIVVIPELDPKP